MANNRSDKSKYPSRYSPSKWVSAPQYITELICEKKARIDKKELPAKFWEIKEWKSFYRNQIATANKLLKTYSAAAVINALKNPKTYKIFSLRAPWLVGIIEAEQKIVDLAEQQPKKAPEFKKVDTTQKPRQQRVTKGRLGKLKDLDEG